LGLTVDLVVFAVLWGVVVGVGLRFLRRKPRRKADDLRRADAAQESGAYDPQAATDAAFDGSVGPVPDLSDE
jgi:hypothetical protein